jgi:hypothetical protein
MPFKSLFYFSPHLAAMFFQSDRRNVIKNFISINGRLRRGIGIDECTGAFHSLDMMFPSRVCGAARRILKVFSFCLMINFLRLPSSTQNIAETRRIERLDDCGGKHTREKIIVERRAVRGENKIWVKITKRGGKKEFHVRRAKSETFFESKKARR